MRQEGARQGAQAIAGECLALRVRRLDRLLSRIYDGALRPHGLTVAQLGLLSAIMLRAPVPPGKLGDILDLERSTVSRNVALLLRQGWVSATVAADGRGQLLSITRRGKALLEAATPSWRRAQRQAKELLAPEGVIAVLTVARTFGQR